MLLLCTKEKSQMKQIHFSIIIFAAFFCSCNKRKADIIIHNATIYTLDSVFSKASCMVIKDGKIIGLGQKEVLENYTANEYVDAAGKYIYPGFIDAHCHFYNYGVDLQKLDLTGTTSYAEVLERAVAYEKTSATEWITGRGWDQNDWEQKEFPTKEKLDELFPHKPVLLTRIDGHAALANEEALKRAGVNLHTKIEGGVIEKRSGNLSGILIDNAVDLVAKAIPELKKEEKIKALLTAEKNCLAVGLTTIDDAGLDKEIIELIDELQKSGELNMRIYAMISANENNFKYYLNKGTVKTPSLHVCSFKFYGDGALGSRGACLLKPYSDKPGEQGFLLNNIGYYKKYAQLLYQRGFQMNTHCIGDSSNRLMLDIYGEVLKGKNDLRWRIEHAQVVDKMDVEKFQKFSVIPSVQPTHATSDMYWAEKRVGAERIASAYAYKDLLKQMNLLAAGSDFPVEHINPLYGFYAAIARKDLKGYPEKGFQTDNALSREEALKAMTIWAAFANFEEQEKGSLEPGKLADFVITDKDIMKEDQEVIPAIKVIQTYINGKKVYGN